MTKKELEGRQTKFSVETVQFVVENNKRKEISHLNDQAIRSSTSAALNYGETQSAESRVDFIHKWSIVMKELRETSINLNIIKHLNKDCDSATFQKLINECEQ
jgi:four helix bundle protein